MSADSTRFVLAVHSSEVLDGVTLPIELPEVIGLKVLGRSDPTKIALLRRVRHAFFCS